MRFIRFVAFLAWVIHVQVYCKQVPVKSQRSSTLVSKKVQKNWLSNSVSIVTCEDFIALFKKARQIKQPVVLIIYADWCAASQEMQNTYQEYAKQFRSQALIATINSDQKGIEPILHILGIQTLPTVIVMHQLEGAHTPVIQSKWLQKKAQTQRQQPAPSDKKDNKPAKNQPAPQAKSGKKAK